MDYHQNARLTIHSREQLTSKVIEEKCTLKQAAACFSVARRQRPNGCGVFAGRD